MGSYYYQSPKKSGLLPYIIAGFIGAIVGGLVVAVIITGLVLDENGVPFWKSRVDGTSEGQSNIDSVVLGDVSDLERTIIDVRQKAGPAVVMITTTQRRVIPFMFEMLVQEVRGLGSGVIFSKDGYILTNRHVIAGSTEIAVVLPDGREFTGDSVRVVGHDLLTDLAVLKISGENFPVVDLGDSDKVIPGQFAIAIGNPYGLDHTTTQGIVSAVNRPVVIDAERNLVLNGMIQTDAPINKGNSGGPLLNTKGEVIGINTAIIQEAQSIGFAIPVNLAKEIANILIKQGKVARPWIGMQVVEITDELIKEYDIPVSGGLGVERVTTGSPAARAGLRVGDIITAINQKPITNIADLDKLMEDVQIGQRLLLTVVRGREEIMVPLTVGELPQEW
jgi:serine protease Do